MLPIEEEARDFYIFDLMDAYREEADRIRTA
jgi:hypothetical protein